MYVRSLRAANTAAQEARALQAGVSKQQQAVTKDSLDVARRLDVKGHNRRLRELRTQMENTLADREAAKSKAAMHLTASVLSAVGTAAVTAVAVGKRLLDRAQGLLHPAEAARMEGEAGIKGEATLAMAKYRRDQAQIRVTHLQSQLRDKERWSWLPGMGPGLKDRQALKGATNQLAAAQQAVYDAGGDLDVPSAQDRRPPHRRDDPARGTAQGPEAPQASADDPAQAPESLPEKPLTAEEEREKYPFEDEAYMRGLLGMPAAADTAGGPPVANQPVSATHRPVPVEAGAAPPASHMGLVGAPGQPPVQSPPERPVSAFAVPPARPAAAPAQPDVTATDQRVPMSADPKAAARWGGGGAQSLPIAGTPAERLHTLMTMARQGTLTRDVITANKDLFTPSGLTRLQGTFLAEMGAAHNGRANGISATEAQLQKHLDQAIGYGHKGPLTPAMREAMLPRAAANLLDAAAALRADPSDATRQAYGMARRDYEDIKYGDRLDDGRLSLTGLLHLVGAEVKQALEPMDVVDPVTGRRQGDVVAQLFGAVELARNTAEAAAREDRVAREQDAVAGRIRKLIQQAENEAGVYGTGPKGGGR